MDNYKETYELYQRFEKNAYYDKIHFFESNSRIIQYLDDHESLGMSVDYIICLFEVGRYYKLLSRIDEIIEVVVDCNFYIYDGEDPFVKLLFIKAAALFNLRKYAEARKLVKSIININPQYPYAKIFYRKILWNQALEFLGIKI